MSDNEKPKVLSEEEVRRIAHETKGRAFTEEEVEIIVTKVEERLLRHFYVNIGKGIWGLAWKGILIALLALAAYGYFSGNRP